ncbi:Methyltransferase-like protein, partial [Leptotrombidium deliense]
DEKNRLENNADVFWDQFYDTHQNKFFKDRHWLFTEFPELLNEESKHFKVLELGAGVGNTVFPLLQTNKSDNLFVFCCDFSKTAISLLKQHHLYDSKRCNAYVCDISKEWTPPFEESSLDVIVMIFTLSAVAPEKMPFVLSEAVKYLKPNGLLLFRDYGRNDLTQLRFKDGRCIRDNYYVRGDGTRTYYFDENEVHQLFTSVGFEKEALFVDKRLQVNRSRQLKMYRVWIQAKYRKRS